MLEGLQNPSYLQLDIVTAWAKRSGLRLLEDSLNDFRNRGGHIRSIVGISSGGATRQGLEMIMQTSSESYVFHDPSGRTFHPKYYLFVGEEEAFAIIGSNNLTSGGLVENYETALRVELDLSDTADVEFLNSLRSSTDRFLSSKENCIELTETTLYELSSKPIYQIADENTISGSRKSNSDSVARRSSRDSIFSSPSGLRRARKQSSRTQNKDTVAMRWHKKLSSADAQQPQRPGTNPTGHLTLVKARHPINHRIWFRTSLFVDEKWDTLGGDNERTSVSFDVRIMGARHGRMNLDVTYAPRFESGQGNRTTVIHWGQLLAHLQQNDYSGKFVSIERTHSEKFNLVIDDAPTGPFLASHP